MCSKPLIRFFAVFIPILLLSACTGVNLKQKRAYYNDRIIASETDSYSYSERFGRTVNTLSQISFREFSGTDTLVTATAAKGDELLINFFCEVEKGEFKVVLITPEGDITDILSGTSSGDYSIEPVPGKYRIKLVGDEATGLVQISISGDCELVYASR